jgi:alkanesulfonate monooxygenase SsuD/methylene tetrahydromethanopterin reductase-like flavin-dependent oxidoreductase (luciferase family)
VHDHLHQSPFSGQEDDPLLEAYVVLGAIAAATDRVWVGSMVTPVTTRHPALIAKMLTTLDVLSHGRAILGLGAGNHPREHRGYGIPFPPIGERVSMLEEAVQICRLMFTQRETKYQGRHFRMNGALNVPPPVRPGGPPILIGGGSERTLRLVARYGDVCGFFGDVEEIRVTLSALDRHCEAIGRDTREITRTRLGALAIAETQGEAERIAEQIRARPMGEIAHREAIIGEPRRVAEQVRVFIDAGLDGLVFHMPDAENIDHVRLAGQTLSELFA